MAPNSGVSSFMGVGWCTLVFGSCEMAIDQEGISEESSRCTFEKVEQTSASAFLVYAKCEVEDMPDSGMTATIEIIDGKLVITPLSEG
jgi:hypothetical protein